MQSRMQTVRLTIRSLVRARIFSLAALVILSLAIGANVAVYAVADALLFKPLPFGDRGARLVTVHATHPTQVPNWRDGRLSYPDLLEARQASRTLAGLEGVVTRNFSVAAADETERVVGASVTPGLFGLLGVQPQLGRLFREDDATDFGAESVALISDALWRRRFGADQSLVGKSILFNGRSVTVIGVMPANFRFPERHDMWVPYLTRSDAAGERRILTTFALLRDGASLDQARQDAHAVATRLTERFPDSHREWDMTVMPFREFFVDDPTRSAANALMAAVFLVLVVSCVNLGVLVMARGFGRLDELRMRVALGAKRGELLSLLMLETVVLAIIGCGVGLLLARWGLLLLTASNPEPPPYWIQLGLNPTMIGFAIVVATLVVIVSGLLPAWRVLRNAGALMSKTRGSGYSRSHRRLQGGLVAAQVAISFGLLFAATLLAQNARGLQYADGGFDPKPLLSARMFLSGPAYNTPAARNRSLTAIVERVRAVPGVVGAAVTSAIPTDDGGEAVQVLPEPGAAPSRALAAQMIAVSPEFFATMGRQLLSGGMFTASESAQEGSDGAVVNRALAQTLWPDGDAVGRRLEVRNQAGTTPLRVTGIAPDMVYEEVGESTAQSRLNIYVPTSRLSGRVMSLMVRTSGDPATAAASVRRAIREADPGIATYDVMTMESRRMLTTWIERFIGRTFEFFALIAILLACFGAYGLAADSAIHRTREIGLRMALGATRMSVLRMFLRRSVTLAVIGFIFGIPLATALARLLQTVLFDVSPWTIVLWTALPAALIGSVVLASLAVARAASMLDPAKALRQN